MKYTFINAIKEIKASNEAVVWERMALIPRDYATFPRR